MSCSLCWNQGGKFHNSYQVSFSGSPAPWAKFGPASDILRCNLQCAAVEVLAHHRDRQLQDAHARDVGGDEPGMMLGHGLRPEPSAAFGPGAGRPDQASV